MLKVIYFLTAAITVSLVLLGIYAFREIGTSPSEEELEQFAAIPYFYDQKFHASEEMRLYPDQVRNGPAGFLRMALPSKFAPRKPLPQIKLTKENFKNAPEPFALYWLGHSAAILEFGGKRIVFDPVLGNAAPVPFAVPRYAPAPVDYDALQSVDYVVITHDHYDHLERQSVQALKDKHFIVPLGVGAALRGWGVRPENITELGWEDSFKKDGLTITAETAMHYSGRLKLGDNKTLWNSYIITFAGKSIYWGGDSGYGEHFAKAGQKYGPFDLAALEIDAWNPGWPNIHLFPDEVVKAARDLKAKYVLPVHWGIFDLALHPWHESIDMVIDSARDTGLNILTPVMGEKVIPGTTQTTKWW